jgi:3-dehydroquinate synthase
MQKSCFNYPVEIVEDVFGESEKLSEALRAVSGGAEPRVLLVADMNVVNRTDGLGSKIGRYFQSHSIKLLANPVVVPGGEKIKTDDMQCARRIISAMLDAKLGVGDAVIVLGGGSVIDVAGYAAAQVRGGIGQVRIPTTVAAMIDGAYSTYSAIDSVNVKDALRVPCEPAAVLVDPLFAKTVLDGVWRGGISEAVRLAVMSDPSYFKKLGKSAEGFFKRDYGVMCEMVRKAVEIRGKKGDTTFAQWAAARLESMSSYKLPHGYAVAIAICIDSAYSCAKGYITEAEHESIGEILRACGALDALQHSRRLLDQSDSVLFGLDAWRLATGSTAITLPGGIGSRKVEEQPDRELFGKVMKDFAAVAASL